jgi:hypothetical protein
MLSIQLEYHCTRLKCSLQGWNAFERVGIPLYSVGMLSTVLEGFRQSWNAFDRVGIPLYTVEMLSRGLECFLEVGNAL